MAGSPLAAGPEEVIFKIKKHVCIIIGLENMKNSQVWSEEK